VDFLEALVLGLAQGLSEFFPVSSSGHLLMLQEILGIHEDGIAFEITVHIATLASVLIVYRKRISTLVSGVFRREVSAIAYVGKLVLATLPAIAAVLIAGDWFDAQFEAPRVAGVCLLVTGAILWTTRSTIERASASEPSWRVALLIGCAQVLAILPGISRSGTTVAAALALGVAPVAAAEFSFLMSVIAIGGAAVRSLPDLVAVPAGQVAPFVVGGIAALVAGIAAIWLFVRLLETHGFYRFAYYTWAAGALFLVWLQFGGGGS
jgi:undecaprenyl-diphosphatase